jgi:hypothetical protein
MSIKAGLAHPAPVSCGDVVRGMVREGGVWGPHSLHTAEATGSKPVTPTSTDEFQRTLLGTRCQQIASKPP